MFIALLAMRYLHEYTPRRTPLFWMSDVDYSTPGKSFTETNSLETILGFCLAFAYYLLSRSLAASQSANCTRSRLHEAASRCRLTRPRAGAGSA